MAFLLKKIIGSLLMPMPLFFLACLTSVLLFALNKQRAARLLLLFSIASLYCLSINPVAQIIAAPLEHKHPKYNNQTVDYVVVLGGYHKSDARLPITSLLSVDSLNRLNEGVRIIKRNPGAVLLLSGHNGKDKIPHSEAMARVAENMGIKRSDMQLYPLARDTDDEARYWASISKGKKLALVTTATHMPRAVNLFKQYGIEPIPAPTGHRTSEIQLTWKSFVPRAFNVDLVAKAWHEYLGIAWAKIRS